MHLEDGISSRPTRSMPKASSTVHEDLQWTGKCSKSNWITGGPSPDENISFYLLSEIKCSRENVHEWNDENLQRKILVPGTSGRLAKTIYRSSIWPELTINLFVGWERQKRCFLVGRSFHPSNTLSWLRYLFQNEIIFSPKWHVNWLTGADPGERGREC